MVSDAELKVVVVGLGYIGLPTAAVIARTGAKVLGIDVSEHVVETVNSGKVHIEEVDLDGLVSGVVARGNLRAATLIEPADVFVIAVPTPFADDHAPNIGYVLRAATTIAAVGDRIASCLTPLLALDGATLRAHRREKFLEMGRTGVV